MKDPSLPHAFFKRDEIIYRAVLPGTVILRDGTTQNSRKRIRLEVIEKTHATLKPVSSDLSLYNTLAVVVHNESYRAIRVGLRLLHGTRTFRPESNDFSTTGDREIVEAVSRREIKFHRECFGTYGLKSDWDNILEIRVHLALEWSKSNGTPFSVHLEGFFVEARRIPVGPRLTYEGLTSHAVSEKNLQALCLPHGIGPFNEQNLGLLMPPPHPYPVETAQGVLEGHIMGKKLTLPSLWDSKPVAELEWEHFLHRHHFMKILVQYFAQTGSDDVVQWLEGAIRSWVAKFPVPIEANGGAGPAWETLSVAWRIREWLWIVGIVWKSPRLELDTRIAILASLWESAQSLMDHKGHPNNWAMVESVTLALIGLCFPEFKEAEQWFFTGVDRVCIELDKQFFPDGVHFELSPLYHAICMGALTDLMHAASFYNKTFPDSVTVVLGKGMDYLAWIMRPDHTWPALNDSGGIQGDYRALMAYAERTLRKSKRRWFARLLDPAHLSEACRTFPDAGITIMRSGHRDSPNYLLFRSGPPGASHIHRDVLSFELYAMGRSWLVDPGITSYAPGDRTDFYRSAKAHNMILIDGLEPRPDTKHFKRRIRSGRESTFSLFGEDIQMAAGMYNGPWDNITREYRWIRSVVSLKGGEYFIYSFAILVWSRPRVERWGLIFCNLWIWLVIKEILGMK